MINKLRRSGNFIIVSTLMATVIAVISTMRQEAIASMLSSKLANGPSYKISRDELSTVQDFLESQIVIQNLHDFGMEKDEAIAKVNEMESEDLHVLASMINKAPAGGDGVGILIGLALVALIVVLIIKLHDKEIVIK